MNNSASIKRGWIRKSEEPLMKYNEAYRRSVAEWTGSEPADSRDGSDTGMEMDTINEQ